MLGDRRAGRSGHCGASGPAGSLTAGTACPGQGRPLMLTVGAACPGEGRPLMLTTGSERTPAPTGTATRAPAATGAAVVPRVAGTRRAEGVKGVEGVRSAMVTSRNRRGPSVMACWQRSVQDTHPPARARRRLVDKNTANAAAAATAATAMAAVIAITSAAASKKWPTGRSNIKNATSTTAAILIAGRA
jgi:hypothetical protein